MTDLEPDAFTVAGAPSFKGQLGGHGGEATAGDEPRQPGYRCVDGRAACESPGGMLAEVRLIESRDKRLLGRTTGRRGERVQAEHHGEVVSGVWA